MQFLFYYPVTSTSLSASFQGLLNGFLFDVLRAFSVDIRRFNRLQPRLQGFVELHPAESAPNRSPSLHVELSQELFGLCLGLLCFHVLHFKITQSKASKKPLQHARDMSVSPLGSETKIVLPTQAQTRLDFDGNSINTGQRWHVISPAKFAAFKPSIFSVSLSLWS